MKKLLLTILIIPFLIGSSYKLRATGSAADGSSYVDYCSDANCVSCWRFDPPQDKLLDITGNNTPLSVNANATYGTGKENNGYTFDGTGDNLDGGSASSIDNIFATGGSISFWMYIDDWGSASFPRIFDKSDGVGTTGWNIYIRDDDDANPKETITFLHTFSTSFFRWNADANSLDIDEWIHIVITYDGSSTSNDPIIYKNGSVLGITEASSGSGTIESDAAYSLLIGNDVNSEGIIGKLDEIALFDDVLSADEVLDIYNNGLR